MLYECCEISTECIGYVVDGLLSLDYRGLVDYDIREVIFQPPKGRPIHTDSLELVAGGCEAPIAEGVTEDLLSNLVSVVPLV